MTMAMRGVVLALLVLRRVPGSHSPTVRIEGGLQNCPWAVPTWPLSLNFFQIVTPPTTRPLVANDGFFDSAQVAYA